MQILVAKKKRFDNKLKVKITMKKTRGYDTTDYTKIVNIRDYKDLALFLEDLKLLFDAPLEKALMEMKKQNQPFW